MEHEWPGRRETACVTRAANSELSGRNNRSRNEAADASLDRPPVA